MKNLVRVILLTLMAVSFIACSAEDAAKQIIGELPDPPPTTPPGGDTDPVTKDINDPNSVVGCPFAVVSVPDAFEGLSTTGGFVETTAFVTPMCKTVAIGLERRGELTVARFEKGGAIDASYNQTGSRLVDTIRGGAQYSLRPSASRDYTFIAAFNWAEGPWDGGPFLMAMDREGEVNFDMYGNGMAYRRVVEGNSSNEFKVSNVTVANGKVTVNGSYYNRALGKKETFSSAFNFVLPNLEFADKTTGPVACEDYTYDSGAINNRVIQLQPDGCDSIQVNWRNLRTNEASSFSFAPGGNCVNTIPFRNSCFQYNKDGILMRRYADRNWDLQTRYMKLVDNKPNLCGVSGTGNRTYLVSSPYPPSDEALFTSICTYQ